MHPHVLLGVLIVQHSKTKEKNLSSETTWPPKDHRRACCPVHVPSDGWVRALAASPSLTSIFGCKISSCCSRLISAHGGSGEDWGDLSQGTECLQAQNLQGVLEVPSFCAVMAWVQPQDRATQSSPESPTQGIKTHREGTDRCLGDRDYWGLVNGIVLVTFLLW